MPVFNPAYGIKECPPLKSWREDDPTLLPHCVVCRRDIRIGSRYYISVVGNAVFCPTCGPKRYRVV